MKKIIVSGLVAGIASGVLLFLVCAYVEYSAEIELMTLLLNIDFVYDGELHLLVEIAIHLVVSIVLATVLKVFHIYRPSLYMPAMVTAWASTVVLYFILPQAAVQSINLEGHIGFLLWVIFHIGFFELLHLFFKSGI